ncbi:MAG: diguanylate cyclase with PAS/PAC sensor [uncultured bacterium (gcode 4)]|uniref:Diguanylate cyclase with PAS/PAC sensor n=1 Tax=uncultured bacterium (gcode 4) TaxID=1234023 RepID=K2AWF0_9BACT|nr:MAG: diguanylate cyclase with PAS/PAC sensor [uncultured bacterium (gcode 4)]
MEKLNKSNQSDATIEIINLLETEKISQDVLVHVKKILEKQDEDIKIGNLMREHIEKAKKFAVVIYEEQSDGREKPVYWSKKMEDLSGYTYEEIIARYNNWESILELLYWHDQDQMDRIKERFNRAKETGIWYENFVCSMRTARWAIIEVAWNTERSENNKYRMSFWSWDFVDIQRMLRMDDYLPCLKKSALKTDFRDYVLNKRWKIEEARSVLALAMIDIDDFKIFNKLYGQMVWDHVLNEFVKFFNSKLRDWDHIYRLGWDEFAILFNTTKHDQITERVTRIKNEFNSINFIVENWQITKHLKQDTPEKALTFYEINKNNGWTILPPIWLSIWISDFNYANIRENKNKVEVDSILEKELNKLKKSADNILYIAKHCYLLNNEYYKKALETEWIVISDREIQKMQNEIWETQEFIIPTTKKCKNFIWTPILDAKWELSWVNIITCSWLKKLDMKKMAIIQRRKEKIFWAEKDS